jgi:hypothetical protein
MRHREENGRTYHAYKDGSKLPSFVLHDIMLTLLEYLYPNDEVSGLQDSIFLWLTSK